MNLGWGGVRMMKSDELGAIFVNEGGRSKIGQSNSRNFGVGRSEIQWVYIDLGVIVTRLECGAARLLCNGYIF